MGAKKEDEDENWVRLLQAVFGRENVKDTMPLTPERREALRAMVQKVLRSLTPREEKVLRMRFGIKVPSDRALEEVAQDFKATRERIRQIEAKALRKLRHPSRQRMLGGGES